MMPAITIDAIGSARRKPVARIMIAAAAVAANPYRSVRM
jgi:hypothetical protein